MTKSFEELSKEVGTLRLAQSQVYSHLGDNVRSRSLVKGQTYIVRERTTAHHFNGDNPFMVVRFLGAGKDENGSFLDRNPTMKELDEMEGHYWFEAYDETEGRTYRFGAYAWNGSLAICSGAVNVSFYAVK